MTRAAGDQGPAPAKRRTLARRLGLAVSRVRTAALLAAGLSIAHTPATSAPGGPAADSAQVPAGLGVPSAPVTRVDNVPMVGANELARLLGASRSWRPDVRKLVLRAGERRLTFTADNPFVIVDDRTVRLSAPVLPRAGELQIPVEIVRLLPRDSGWPRLAYDADSRQLRVAPRDGFVGAPRVETRGSSTILVIPSERAEAAAVIGRSRARFRVRMAGALVGALPDSLPDDGLVRDLAVSRSPGGVTFEVAVDGAAMGWRLERDPASGRVTLLLARGADDDLEAFAAEGAKGPRVVRTVVLDPGHGGDESGVRAEGAEEKSLALELALRLADELQRRGGVRVLLTRRDDRAMSQESRAEAANRVRADAVLSLHFGAFADPSARGTLAWCAPATRATGAESAARAAGLVALIPWRDVALERAVESRGLAESITAALERAGIGPASVRERLPLALLGVQSPGVLLECGSLSNPEERARLLSPDGIRALASAITDGVLAWQRNE